MFNLKIENVRGQQFTLTNKESQYQVISIDGLNPPNAIINSNSVAGMDGSRFASSKLGERNIVITVKINGDVEKNRLFLYNYFRTKQYCKIYYENESRNVYAEGHVETIECSLFENGQTMQISIVCNDPYLKAIEEITHDLTLVISKFEFPFSFGAAGIVAGTITDEAIEFSMFDSNKYVSVINEGDDESGFIIEIAAIGTVTNPIIYNVDTNEYMKMDMSLITGDVLTIDTILGEKSIFLTHNATKINSLRNLNKNSKWLKLQIGANKFTCSADYGAEFMQISFKYRTHYEGV